MEISVATTPHPRAAAPAASAPCSAPGLEQPLRTAEGNTAFTLKGVQISRRRPRLRENVRDEAVSQHRIPAYRSSSEQIVLMQQTREVDFAETGGQRLGLGQIIGVWCKAPIGNTLDYDEAPTAP